MDDSYKEFNIPLLRKEDVLKEMGGQLKTWRWNMRHKHLQDLDATGIMALKDHVPPKENIRTSQWNAFIKHEETAKKLQQRRVLKDNMANKNDVHCLATDPDRRSPTRSEVYLESRKQRKLGELHSKVDEACQKFKEFSSSEDSSSQASLEDDALTQVFVKDSRGRTCGVGRVSKGTMKAIQPMKSNIGMVLNSNLTLREGCLQHARST